MQDTMTVETSAVGGELEAPLVGNVIADKSEVVSTHVLVEQEKVDRLRELSRRTRIAPREMQQTRFLRRRTADRVDQRIVLL